jgi:hypothetical protein
MCGLGKLSITNKKLPMVNVEIIWAFPLANGPRYPLQLLAREELIPGFPLRSLTRALGIYTPNCVK